MDLSRHKFFDGYDGVDDDDDGVTVVVVVVAVFGKHKFDFYHRLIDYSDAVAVAAAVVAAAAVVVDVVGSTAVVAVGSDNFDPMLECRLTGFADKLAPLLCCNVVEEQFVAVVVLAVDCGDWLVVV